MDKIKGVAAKFKVVSKTHTEHEHGEQHKIELTAVTDEVFGPYTPSGNITMCIVPEDAINFFKPGKEYSVIFTESHLTDAL